MDIVLGIIVFAVICYLLVAFFKFSLWSILVALVIVCLLVWLYRQAQSRRL